MKSHHTGTAWRAPIIQTPQAQHWDSYAQSSMTRTRSNPVPTDFPDPPPDSSMESPESTAQTSEGCGLSMGPPCTWRSAYRWSPRFDGHPSDQAGHTPASSLDG